MLRFLFFSTEGLIIPVAQKLQEEGAEVLVGQVQDLKFTLTEEELKNEIKPEDPKLQKRRLLIGDGLVNKEDAMDVVKSLKKLDSKGYFVAGDMNNCFAFTQKAYELGFTGMLALEEDRKLEVARDEAKTIVKKNYPDLKVTECQEFQKAQDGIKFLQESDQVWVLKSKGDSGETVCPKIDDSQLANQELIGMLEENAECYEENGFMLEQKILDGVEMTPQAVFWDGKLVFTDLDIETKTLGCGELGPNVGCGMNLIIRTDPDDHINKIAFPPYIHELASKRKGMFIIDCGIIFDRRTNEAYFTEFCFQRFGWDAFPAELAMCESVENYFKAVVKGENPLKRRFGVGIRLFNLNQDDEGHTETDMGIDWAESTGQHLFLYDVKEVKDRMVTVGHQKDLGVVVESDDKMMDAIDRCYDYARQVAFNDIYYRAKDDFMSCTYPQAILKRLRYAVEQGLIKNEGILQEMGATEASPLEMLEEFNRKYKQTAVDNQELIAKLRGYKEHVKSMEIVHSKGKENLKKKHEEEIAKVKSTLHEILTEN